MKADPIPAIREEDATGQQAAIFADLRATLRVPFVNLIWRHLATMPEMLEWTWALLKPLYTSEALVEASGTLRAAVTVPAGIAQPACVFDAVGVTASDRAVIATMLRDYNAANAANLLCLLVAQSVMAGEGPQGQASALAVHVSPRSPSPSLPRLPGLDELAPELRALVLALDQFGRTAQTEAIASLYRHVAHWPGFLALAHAALSPAQRDGTLRAEHDKTRERAQTLAAERLLPLAGRPGTPPPAQAEAARRSLQAFTTDMIARMTAMGEIMLALLPA